MDIVLIGMMRFPQILLAAAVITAALLFAVPLADQSLSADDEQHAEYTITSDPEGNTVIRGSGVPAISYPSGADITVCILSDSSQSVSVTLNGASVGELILCGINSRQALDSDSELTFTMTGGSVERLIVAEVSGDAEKNLGTSFDSMFMPFGSVTVCISGGHVTEYMPTHQMIAIRDYSLNIGPDAEIDRLYVTGEHGRYGSCDISVSGSRIGYMTNTASKIASISYLFESCTVDYLCIGADTEQKRTQDLADMPTFYVTGDVTAVSAGDCSIGNCILGSGILTIPNYLFNGEYLNESPVHNIIIDLPDVAIRQDCSFLDDDRSRSAILSGYEIGSTVRYAKLLSSVSTGSVTIPVYSEKGVWDSVSSSVINTGSKFTVNADYIIPSDSVLTIDPGSFFVNSGIVSLSGALDSQGSAVNNRIIELRAGYSISGSFEGIGIQAEYVYYISPTSLPSVITSTDAVIIAQSSAIDIRTVSSEFLASGISFVLDVTDAASLETDRLMICLRESAGPSGFDSMINIITEGIEESILTASSADITIPLNEDVCTAICILDDDAGEYVIIAKSEYESEMTFDATGHTEFYLYEYIGGEPDIPTVKKGMSVLDYAIMASIMAVFLSTAYIVITMKRED